MLGAGTGACAPSHPGTPANETAIVVGIQDDEVSSVLQNVHYTVKVPGQPDVDKTVAAQTFPAEVKVAPGADLGAQIDVKVEGLVGAGQPPLITRLASTHFVSGQTMLLRVALQGRCEGALPGGGPGAPACDAPLTCIGGLCASSLVAPNQLEPYTAKWPTDAPDMCKPAGHGPPDVMLGTGQTDYLRITDGQTLKLEKGPQGGHHVWIAVRMKNLKQSGSTTTVTGVQPGTGLSVPPTGVVFTFDGDEGGYCKLFGITFRLDSPSDLAFYKNFLGKPLDIAVVVKDGSGDSGTGTGHINVAPLLVCPAGDADPLCEK